ncbi:MULTISPECIES: endonuclease/exonuclease/phosphatase family protein [unclassified Actinomyces]|uniref:endonuclease/exonuclease/phosphatase family protein n=3 Tax=Actinomyces TaxID=1654 RepID=UPI002017B039|nr:MULTISPECIES: endonuclease/exonuclease/phosphatase family protein [unclassified Actinomyces]MCL3777815.1 endonuclease/exonuclease/phosphatase family protein [Actinomyces sp. AC-20-1]MCL3790432.1 endonuclease/exonuclease/phosphatase family protein [Actinomyces sp. 187325]MCL3792709.1 endonuclease/exonuclease/phosphatase family protein [Actinomyces sp. 186855]MCL3795189.1 endonuclease/exonuclease/phosphatase family protein [Actinomyces sp. 217892]
MSDPTPHPDDPTAPAAPAERSGVPATRSTWQRVRRATGWCVAVVLGLLAVLTLAPDLLAGLSEDLRLSMRYPFAQALAVRSGLVLILALVGLVVAVSALTRVLRREGGLRTGVLALVLLLVAGTHTWVLWDRGLETTDLATAPAAAGEPWDGGLTVLTFNTYGGRAHTVELAIAIRSTAPDVVVLPETSAEDTTEILALLAQDGLAYTPFTTAPGAPEEAAEPADAGAADPVAETAEPADAVGEPAEPAGDLDDPADPAASPEPTPTAPGAGSGAGATSVLVSAGIGEYEQASAPDGLGHGAVLLQPVGDALLDGHQRPTILGVHTIAPLKDTMEPWAQSVSRVVAQCAAPAPGLVLAGDLNATLDHAPMRDLGGCTDAALQAGGGGLSTWPVSTRTPLLGSPIDHVLIDTATWTSTGVDLIEVPGSDHRALVVTLEQH